MIPADENNYTTLEELSKSDFEIVDGEPDITGWKVINESGTYIGSVKELLFDSQDYAVRYLIIDLSNNGMQLNDKQVMIPIGLAHLHVSEDEVVLPNIHLDQFNALPNYETGRIGPDTEMYIRSVIGSPAALRIEEKITAFDQRQFYAHHHFNHKKFYHRGSREASSHQDFSSQDLADNSQPSNSKSNNMLQNQQPFTPDMQSQTPDEAEIKNPSTRGI